MSFGQEMQISTLNVPVSSLPDSASPFHLLSKSTYLPPTRMPDDFPQVICSLIARKTKGFKWLWWNFRHQLAGAQGLSGKLSWWQALKGKPADMPFHPVPRGSHL